MSEDKNPFNIYFLGGVDVKEQSHSLSETKIHRANSNFNRFHQLSTHPQWIPKFLGQKYTLTPPLPLMAEGAES